VATSFGCHDKHSRPRPRPPPTRHTPSRATPIDTYPACHGVTASPGRSRAAADTDRVGRWSRSLPGPRRDPRSNAGITRSGRNA